MRREAVKPPALGTPATAGGDGAATDSLANEHDRSRKPDSTFRDHARAQPFATGSVMKRLLFSRFIRTSTLDLFSLRASLTALRTSPGEDTFLPPTSRMTSPDCMP